jgi:hypothetical protein
MKNEVVLVGKLLDVIRDAKGDKCYYRLLLDVTTDDKYPTKAVVDVKGAGLTARIEEGNLPVGNVYEVKGKLSSREWNGKWYGGATVFLARYVSGDAKGKGGGSVKPNVEEIKADEIPF